MAAEDDLLQSVQSAPRFGLNAKALILQIAQAGDNDAEDEAAQRTKRQRRDPAAAAAAAACKHGAAVLALVDPKQRPLIAYVPRAKIPRVNRQTVLNKLAGEHLVLAALRRRPPPRPQAAAADAGIRQEAFEAALDQERELYGRCGSTAVYLNLASRASAAHWLDERRQAQRAAAGAAAAARQEPQRGQGDGTGAAQRGGPVDKGSQNTAAPQAARQQERQQGPGRGGSSGKGRHATPAASLLEEVELDWDAALPCHDVEAEGAAAEGAAAERCTVALPAATARAKGEVEQRGAADCPATSGTPQQAASAAPTSARTQLGGDALAPLPMLPAAASVQQPDEQAEAGRAAEAVRLPAPSERSAADVVAGQPGGGSADVAGQVAEFVRGELRPLLQAGQLRGEQYEVVAARCTAKVMGRHAAATSADFLEPEAEGIRALVRRYVEHLAQR